MKLVDRERMMSIEKKEKEMKRIKDELVRLLPSLKVRYKLKSLGIFGSYVRNEQNEGSDLDMLVSFDEKPSLFKYIELENYLSDIVHTNFVLVLYVAFKQIFGTRILNEVVMLGKTNDSLLTILKIYLTQ